MKLNYFWKPFNDFLTTNVKTNSWYKHINYDSICNYPLLIDNNICDNISVIRASKVEIFPTLVQKKILSKWFEDYRLMYNHTLYYIRSMLYHNLYYEKLFNYEFLRTNILKNQKNKLRINKIPSHTLDNAIKDCCASFKSAISNLKAKNIKYFKIRYIKQSKSKQTITLETSAFSKNKNTFCQSILGNFIDSGKFDLTKINKNCKLQYNNITGQFFLFVPIERECKEQVKNDIVSIDPGVRTFLTCYSSNRVEHIGINTLPKIKKYINQIDKINGAKYEIKSKLKKQIIEKRYQKIQNLIADLHWKTANHLCRNYGTIYLGEISTQSIVSNMRRNINKSTKRALHALSHYKFRERLKSKCEEYNVKLKLVNESYTSKTCCHCGYIDHKLGSNKEYVCKNKYCGLKIERDINGAINILKKGLNG